ncbi:serine/threonine protein kinase [Xylanimonas cellulosilytica DSM 15894]|uniref:non-specific serine/threonine protein kinase n=1 Tax=Xylanimonas cellulosilytica (strain DSM 15894 / JCM 12276 / CECT 5975 / KCTC 9989 / LMG 20990 / NBRC 107835 / XIL07) TaxID=446471 RepID=D1BTB8_XYLCX|nr:serine/threonine-protein kinase [Xylanimonas cellulosilytica]ACZ29060.1 serine/threonine protein kinase [Xylanimonas cellulosilytica DSM 15894]
MRPVAGLALGDRYHLTRQVAVGGMGEVWVADDAFLGRDVAVKVLREEYTGQEDFLKRLRTEARNSAALSHVNIAQMYDYGEQGGTGYLVMELVLGEPLADLLEREPVLPPKRLLPILAQTARGLHHAHECGVVHRDVKPGNILLEHPGRAAGAQSIVKITDFGVSLAANQAPMTATGMVMGTAQYLSPEQAVGQPATPLSDVYALGVVAYEATAGKRPFTGSTPVDIAVAHVNNPVPPLPTTVHPELAALVYRLLEKDPVKRPTSAGALADELEALGADIAADPLGARSRTARRLRSAAASSRAASSASSSSAARSSASSASAASSAASSAAASSSERPSSGPTTPGAEPLRASWPQTAAGVGGTAASDLTDDSRSFGELVGESRPGERTSPQHAGARPTPLPLRRDVHGARPTGRSPEASRTVDALRRDLARRSPHRGEETRGAGRRPADPSAHRQQADPRTPAEGQRRTSTTTGLRLGRWGNVSWPLVGLAVLLVVLLIATLIRNLSGGDDGAAAAPQSNDRVTAAASSLPDSGMMLRNVLRGEAVVTMTSKDM